MSDIWISINHLPETTTTTAPHAGERKGKRLKRKRHQSEKKSSTEGGYESNSRMKKQRRAQRWNGAPAEQSSFSASTNNNSLRHPGSTARTSERGYDSSTSAPNSNFLPSSSSTATSDCRPSGSKPNKNLSVGGFPHSSSRPPASAHIQPSFTVTVNSSERHVKPKTPWSSGPAASTPASSASSSHKQPTAKTAAAGIRTKYLAIDCEMVGAGPKGSINQLARCSVVNFDGDVVYDKFIKPSMPVTDYRTRWSGVRCSDLNNATPYAVARKEILKLLNGKVVIGHAIHNDFKVLGYSHPAAMTRDTSRIPLLNQKAGFPDNQSASLKRLTKAIFNRDIQTGKRGHSSVEDARATMELYKVVEAEWERTLASGSGQSAPGLKRQSGNKESV